MVFEGVGQGERIYMREHNDDVNHWVDMDIAIDEPTFTVTCCCDEEFIWEFWYTKTDYELVKYVIMDCINMCENMSELCDMLGDMFMDSFEGIMVENEDDECNGGCDRCMFKIDDSKYLQ